MGELTGLRHADAVIVGAGLTGLLLGSGLAQSGLRVILLDAGDGTLPPLSAAGTFLCPDIFERIETAWGTDAARAHAFALQAQLQHMAAAPPPYVQESPAYLYARTRTELPMLEARHALLNRLQLPVSVAPDAGGCPFPVELSLVAQGQAVMDLPSWRAALMHSVRAHGGQIFLRSRVIAMDSTRVCTAKGCVDAPVIVLTTGTPLGLRSRRMLALLESRMQLSCHLTGPYPLHTIQLPLAAEGLTLCPSPAGMTVSRYALRCGNRRQAMQPALFERLLSDRVPGWQQGELHNSIQVLSADGLPFIGTLPGTRHLFASGYGGQGVLGAMHAADVLMRRILGHAAPEDRLYAPDRAIPRRVIQPAMRRSAALYGANLVRRSAPSCPHCGCRMRYLTAFQRWDCPFCGSGYTMLGMPARGPGMRPARVSVRQRPDV